MPTVALNILFIGNSFTQRNDLPGLTAVMAHDRGVRVRHKLISASGASLRTHWNAGRAVKEIEAGEYDYVVLQEQSRFDEHNRLSNLDSHYRYDTEIRSLLDIFTFTRKMFTCGST